MSAALASEGENLTKLEKADVLELTVRHLHQLHREGELTLAAAATGLFGGPLHQRSAFPGVATAASPTMDRRRYQGGFLACAQQVASYVMKTPGLEPALGQRLLAHLARVSQQISPGDGPAHPHAVPALPAALPPALHPESPPSFVFPLAHPALPREYSITAQFQVYRNINALPGDSSGFRAEVGTAERSDDESASSPYSRIANIPKKRQNSGDPAHDPAPGPSAIVVESRIVHFPAAANGSVDAKDAVDPMWRPW